MANEDLEQRLRELAGKKPPRRKVGLTVAAVALAGIAAGSYFISTFFRTEDPQEINIPINPETEQPDKQLQEYRRDYDSILAGGVEDSEINALASLRDKAEIIYQKFVADNINPIKTEEARQLCLNINRSLLDHYRGIEATAKSRADSATKVAEKAEQDKYEAESQLAQAKKALEAIKNQPREQPIKPPVIVEPASDKVEAPPKPRIYSFDLDDAPKVSTGAAPDEVADIKFEAPSTLPKKPVVIDDVSDVKVEAPPKPVFNAQNYLAEYNSLVHSLNAQASLENILQSCSSLDLKLQPFIAESPEAKDISSRIQSYKSLIQRLSNLENNIDSNTPDPTPSQVVQLRQEMQFVYKQISYANSPEQAAGYKAQIARYHFELREFDAAESMLNEARQHMRPEIYNDAMSQINWIRGHKAVKQRDFSQAAAYYQTSVQYGYRTAQPCLDLCTSIMNFR